MININHSTTVYFQMVNMMGLLKESDISSGELSYTSVVYGRCSLNTTFLEKKGRQKMQTQIRLFLKKLLAILTKQIVNSSPRTHHFI